VSYSLQKRDRGDINVDKLSIGSRAKSKMADSPGPSSNNRDASSGTKKASSSASSPSELTRPVHLARISNRKSQSKGLPRQKKLERLAGYSMCTKVTEVQCDILNKIVNLIRGHFHIHVATDKVESTLLFHHPPTPDNVDRYSVLSILNSQLLFFTAVIGWDCILIQYLNNVRYSDTGMVTLEFNCQIATRYCRQVHIKNQALKYRSVTDIVRPIREIVRRREETTGHSVRPK
jgi:hypothetical protein